MQVSFSWQCVRTKESPQGMIPSNGTRVKHYPPPHMQPADRFTMLPITVCAPLRGAYLARREWDFPSGAAPLPARCAGNLQGVALQARGLGLPPASLAHEAGPLWGSRDVADSAVVAGESLRTPSGCVPGPAGVGFPLRGRPPCPRVARETCKAWPCRQGG